MLLPMVVSDSASHVQFIFMGAKYQARGPLLLISLVLPAAQSMRPMVNVVLHSLLASLVRGEILGGLKDAGTHTPTERRQMKKQALATFSIVLQ